MKTYMKAIIGTLAAVATWGVTAGADGNYSQVELWGLLGVIAAAVGVYAVTNAPDEGAHPVDGPDAPLNP
jgi:hypothetical protein